MKRNKRLLAVLTACGTMIAGMPVNHGCNEITANAEETEYIEGTYEFLTYRNYGDHIMITECDASATEVEIPSEIDGVPVTEISGWLFFEGNSSLTTLIIPDSVTYIGEYAFCGCTELLTIEIPENLTDIHAGAFLNTAWIEEQASHDPLIIINGVVNCGAYCTGDVVIPDGVTAINDMAFFENFDLTSVTIKGNSLTSIGEYAFYCSGLSAINLPEGLTEIGRNAFMSTSISEIHIPEGVTNIGAYAFCSAFNLSAVYLPNSIKTIGLAFDYCDMLTDVYYDGTEEEWSQVSVDPDMRDGTTILNNAVIHFLRESTGSSSLGDVNLDGNVDAADAAAILIAAAAVGSGAESGLDAEQEALADLNADGAFDASDAALVLQYAAYAGAGGDATIEEFLNGQA